MFIDKAKLYVSAGDGGNGATSFFRLKSGRRAKPCGGGGGKGGDAVITADANLITLADFKYRSHFKAQSGAHGSGNNKKGARGRDCIIKIPAGTVIIDTDTGLVIRDLSESGQSVIVCAGGAGGLGNKKNVPATPGQKGERRTLSLELKLIADCAIVGLPNAGKSSLINKISGAKSKVACFPFTTKAPVLGVVNPGADNEFRIIDVPGLIKDAHKGRGLGLEFLRHIERTKLILHLIDMAAVDGRDPVEDFRTLNEEFAFYKKGVCARIPQLIAANKMDLPEAQKNLTRFRECVKEKVYPICALTGEGAEELTEAIFRKLTHA